MRRPHSISIATAFGGQLFSSVVLLGTDERKQLELMLGWLFKLGHLAGYSLKSIGCLGDAEEAVRSLRRLFGEVLVDSIAGCELSDPELPPAYLVPVWHFDRGEGGWPVATANFLGTDVEVTAVRSLDEEVGFPIPGEEGLFLPLIMPVSALCSAAAAAS